MLPWRCTAVNNDGPPERYVMSHRLTFTFKQSLISKNNSAFVLFGTGTLAFMNKLRNGSALLFLTLFMHSVKMHVEHEGKIHITNKINVWYCKNSFIISVKFILRKTRIQSSKRTYYQILFVSIRPLCRFASRRLCPLPLNSFSRWSRRRAKRLKFVARRWVTQPGSQSTA